MTDNIDNSKFNHLRDVWLIETKNLNPENPIDYYNETYHKIIGLKNEAIPCILRELVKEGENPNPWFYALRMITHINPVPKELNSNVSAMSKKWIEWGDDKGFIKPNEALEELKKEFEKKFFKQRKRVKKSKEE